MTNSIDFPSSSKKKSLNCLWLDQFVNDSEDNLTTQSQLRQLIAHLQTFTKDDECEQYIKKLANESIVLIVSGSCGRRVIPRLHNLPQISACYVFCQDKVANEKWAKEYSKVVGVHIYSTELIAQIARDQRIFYKLDESLSISVVPDSKSCMETRNALYLWFQLYIDILLRMNNRSSDRRGLIELCEHYCENDTRQLSILYEFEENYKSEDAIWWYTRESCIYRILNKALREQNLDELFVFRFLIVDIATAINFEYEKLIRQVRHENKLQIYRGQFIDRDELKLIGNSLGKFLSMNSFLSTSFDREMALKFIRCPIEQQEEKENVLFEIDVDLTKKSKAFANVAEKSCLKEENEVLVTLGALFRIDQVIEDKQTNLWIIRLSLAAEEDFPLQEILQHIKGKIDQETNLDTLGKFLLRMDENERAEKCYEQYLRDTLINESNALLGLAWANSRRNNSEQSLINLNKALQIRVKIFGNDHPTVGEVHSFLGEVLGDEENYDQAVKHLQEAIRIQEKFSADKSTELAATFETLAKIYTSTKKFDQAAQFYAKVLKIRRAVFPADHWQIASCYRNLGWMYEEKRDEREALNYYEKALEMARKTLPPTHRHIVQLQDSLIRLKKKMRTSVKVNP